MPAIGSLSSVPVRPGLPKRERPPLRLTSTSGGGKTATFGYDGAGNMTSVSGSLYPNWTLGYDDESRLVSMTHDGVTDTYVYNALGQRMRDNLPNLECWAYTYDGDRVIEENCQNGGHVRSRYTTENGSYYAPLLGMRICCLGQIRFPVYDGVGAVRNLVDSLGVVKESYDYDTFGGRRSGTPGVKQQYRYGGAWGYRTNNPGNGLVQLGARFYWPELGRFVQQDPIGDDINWYAYASNDPAVFIDPEGLWGCGIVASATTDAGPPLFPTVQAGQTVTPIGLALFGEGTSRLSLGGFSSWGGFATDGAGLIGYPSGPNRNPRAMPFYAGGGLSLFLTNADRPSDLAGPAAVYNFNLGAGKRTLSIQYTKTPGGVRTLSFAGWDPVNLLVGIGVGISYSTYNATTAVWASRQISPRSGSPGGTGGLSSAGGGSGGGGGGSRCR